MDNFHEPVLAPPALWTNQYSILHQDRLFLLNALANEEERGERLAYALVGLKSKLENFGERKAENEIVNSSEPQITARKLKLSIKTVKHKIGRCQHRERALSADLAIVIARMEGLDRYRWRCAQQVYNLQSQYDQLVMMSPLTPEYTVQSPLIAGVTAQMQYMGFDSSIQSDFHHAMSPENVYQAATAAHMPQTPAILPANVGHSVPMHPRPRQTIVETDRDTNLISPISPISRDGLAVMTPSSEDQSESSITSSFLKGARPRSWPSVESGYEADASSAFEKAEPKAGTVTPKLRRLDATGSGIGLDNLKEEESDRMSS